MDSKNLAGKFLFHSSSERNVEMMKNLVGPEVLPNIYVHIYIIYLCYKVLHCYRTSHVPSPPATDWDMRSIPPTHNGVCSGYHLSKF